MKSPYTVLGIAEDANDETVKKAWLNGVRAFPPDLHPERFREIRNAYEQVATKKDRLRYELFNTSCLERDEIAQVLFQDTRGQAVLTEEFFQGLLTRFVGTTVLNLE